MKGKALSFFRTYVAALEKAQQTGDHQPVSFPIGFDNELREAEEALHAHTLKHPELVKGLRKYSSRGVHHGQHCITIELLESRQLEIKKR